MSPASRSEYKVVLVLSGGNALGSYQAGAYQALMEGGIEPEWIVGASVGAVNGAIICGSSSDERMEHLRQYWRPANGKPMVAGPWSELAERTRRTLAAQATLAIGQPHAFLPRHPFGSWWGGLPAAEPGSLFDTVPLDGTLNRLVDFDRLNSGEMRFSVTAVDLESGDDVLFDNQNGLILPEHLRASSGLLPLFPPVEIGGRLLCDPAASANLPVDVVLGDPCAGSTLCVAIDLLPLQAVLPRELGDSAERIQDLLFANQSRHAIAGWKRFYDLQVMHAAGQEDAQTPSVTLLHLRYGAQGPEICGKALDFSPPSAAYRWERGYSDMNAVLARLDAGEIVLGRPGLTIHAFQAQEEG